MSENAILGIVALGCSTLIYLAAFVAIILIKEDKTLDDNDGNHDV
ncbi:hypothetical protein ACFOQM_23665 [Paenibacillus sp. GCM10012307]|nr:hypothetical protein [Paenibacillus roseus]